MNHDACEFCGNIILSDDPVTVVYLNPQNNSWITKRSTPFQLLISPCCGDENCVTTAWEKAKLLTIGNIEGLDSIQSTDSTKSSYEIWREEQEKDKVNRKKEREEWEKNERLEKEFHQSDIAKQMDRIIEEQNRFISLEKYRNAFQLTAKLLDLVPSHFSHWIKTVGNIDSYDNPCDGAWIDLIQGHVVLMDEDGIFHVLSVIEKLNNLSNSSFYDMEVIQQDVHSFIADIKVFRKILDYVRVNPKVSQNKLYKVLSLKGREASYMLEYAHDMKIISRTRHRDTWLLQVCE